MILRELPPRCAGKEKYNYADFDRNLTDTRLTQPSEKIYRLREAILLSKQLGRELSDEEMKQFEVN